MKSFLILVLAVGCAVAAHDPGLRVKFDVGPRPGIDFFFNVPRNIGQAVVNRWRLTPRPEGPLPSLSLYCHADLTVCVFLDDTGRVAGLQIAFDQTELKGSVFDMKETGFTEWVVTTSSGQVRSFWSIAMYFVSEDYLRLPAAEREANRDSSKLLQEEAVWVTGFNGTVVKISDKESEIHKSIFTRQACVPWMGSHYYYDMRKDTECRVDTLFSWFPLTDLGDLVGLGLSVFGKYPVKPGQRDWFEHPYAQTVKNTVHQGPECLYDLASNPGTTTMHVYFINKPWDVECPSFNK